jgi:transposase InsO family protein
MIYRFMHRQRRYHRVAKMARVLGVSRGGYYAWVKRRVSARTRADRELSAQIAAIQQGFAKYRYGTPRMTRELHRRGYQVGHNRVARLMRENGLQARRRRKYRVTTMSRHNRAAAPNRLARNFNPPARNTVWASDITYIDTAEGWLYLCVVLDLYDRRVVGWSMSSRLTATALAGEALETALMRTGRPSRVLFHSDRGIQYAAGQFRRTLARYGIVQSMSRTGNCWDNAVVESFFSSLKSELIGTSRYATRAEAKAAIFEYIEIFYNRQRAHSSLGYVPPEEYGSHVA